MTGQAAITGFITATLLAGGISLAQDLPPPEIDPGNDPVVVADDLDEVAEALQTLDAAQVPPTTEELARFLAEAGRASEADSLGPGPLSLTGSALVRSGLYRIDGWDHYGKLALESRWLRGRARVRQYRYGWTETTGTVEMGADPLEVRVGDLGLVQGYGLLCGAPGRGQSLAADAGLGPRTERLTTWLGAPDYRAVTGVGLQAHYRSWRLRMMSGHRSVVPAGAQMGNRIRVLQVSWTGSGLKVSAAALSEYRSQGISISGTWNHPALSGSFETLAWKVAPEIPATGAAVLRLKWRLGSSAGLEGQWGASGLPAAPGLASRPGVLSGWAGHGYVLRGFVRAGPGLMVRALVHRARHLDRVGIRHNIGKVLADFLLEKKVSSQVDLVVRYRSTGTQSWSWSERYPWQQPLAGRPQHRTVLSVQVARACSLWRARCLVRSYGLDGSSGSGRRSLFSLSARYSPRGNWKLRGAWTTAWGDPVDLVSAIVPLTGMVLPRHWGGWRSETVLGAEWRYHRVRLQAAGSWRQPEKGQRVGPVWTLWLEAGFRW